MGELLIRRREMIQPSSTPVITPACELPSPVSAANTQIDWYPFGSMKDFTILCEANCADRNWSYNYSGGKNPSIFALTVGSAFRLGFADSYNYYSNGVKTGTDKTPYLALIFNQASSSDGAVADSDPLKCASLYARDATTSKSIKRVAVRFDYANLKVEGFSARGESQYRAPTFFWWNVETYLSNYTTTPITLNFHTGTSSTINIFRAYDCKLSDDQINDFLDGVT